MRATTCLFLGLVALTAGCPGPVQSPANTSRLPAAAAPSPQEDEFARGLREGNSSAEHYALMLECAERMAKRGYDAGMFKEPPGRPMDPGDRRVLATLITGYQRAFNRQRACSIEWRLNGTNDSGEPKPNDIPISFLAVGQNAAYDASLIGEALLEFRHICDDTVLAKEGAASNALMQAHDRFSVIREGPSNVTNS